MTKVILSMTDSLWNAAKRLGGGEGRLFPDADKGVLCDRPPDLSDTMISFHIRVKTTSQIFSDLVDIEGLHGRKVLCLDEGHLEEALHQEDMFEKSESSRLKVRDVELEGVFA